ncbi:acyl-CoA dehydrogenase [Gordonia soli]|uniref:Putative acyl-CoA dehydrogenase n=1 Tax=Gordonia soli NBRC 108243 TaxID=1223545 RepID=M0QJ34_9ACTN|nr:acyl-CoA dehydrogenase [Gordonia soli]GAC68449.1 putative acyl-CoA dehydrogenase [Gordonia soli NBRC 108243]
MEFLISDVHEDLASSLDAMLTKSDLPSVIRAWSAGDRDPARKVFAHLTDAGVSGLLIDESHGGSSAGAIEMVVALEQLGRHAVPGPLAESIAAVPVLLRSADAEDRLSALAEGALATCAIPPLAPFAADAETATAYLVDEGRVSTASPTDTRASVDATRTVSRLEADSVIATDVDAGPAIDVAVLATAAQLLGLASTMLAIAAEYAQARKQFGRAIGSFQAVKHHLADVAIAIEMARPLVHGAALGIDGQVPEGTDVHRDVSAAKVAAGDAANLSARRALQVLGAIGYTAEHDLSLYLTKTRALLGAWGTAATHRHRILETLG